MNIIVCTLYGHTFMVEGIDAAELVMVLLVMDWGVYYCNSRKIPSDW